MEIEKRRKLAQVLVRKFFKNDEGKQFEMTDGQADIFNTILLKDYFIRRGYNRIQIEASTQYGKSSTIAMATILRSQGVKEDWGIVAGRQDKAEIIMGHIIKHLFDDERLLNRLDIDEHERLDRIRRERSRRRLTWKGGGEVRTFSAQAGSQAKVKDSLTGFGMPNLVEDESALIGDSHQAMIMRMLGAFGGGYLVKVGNPFERNHFLRSSKNPRYYKIWIDYQQGLREGRYTEDFIDEMREEDFFDILYECGFPKEDEIDTKGFQRLIVDERIEKCKEIVEHSGKKRLGFDFGEGGDENIGVVRSDKFAEVVHRSKVPDLMAQVGIIVQLVKDYGVKWDEVYLDGTGIGAGAVDRLEEMDKDVNGIKWAEKSILSETKYANLKAENYFETMHWLKAGGRISDDEGFDELKDIKWKRRSDGRILIKSKEDMRKEGIQSPNVADALALTFNKIDDDVNVMVA